MHAESVGGRRSSACAILQGGHPMSPPSTVGSGYARWWPRRAQQRAGQRALPWLRAHALVDKQIPEMLKETVDGEFITTDDVADAAFRRRRSNALTGPAPVSVLLGALTGGCASLWAAIYTQRYQNRLQRVASEIAKRETVYADFVMNASNLLLKAYVRDEIVLGGEEQRLIGLINRMRLFAPSDVVKGAEAVLRAIVEISLKPGIELRRLANEALSESLDPDPLLSFSSICRADLDNIRRTAV